VRKLAGRLEMLRPVITIVDGSAYDIAEVRASLADVVTNKPAFDRWLLTLHGAGIVRLREDHDIPRRIDDPEAYVRDPQTGRDYSNVAMQKEWEKKAAGVPPISVFIEAETPMSESLSETTQAEIDTDLPSMTAENGRADTGNPAPQKSDLSAEPGNRFQIGHEGISEQVVTVSVEGVQETEQADISSDHSKEISLADAINEPGFYLPAYTESTGQQSESSTNQTATLIAALQRIQSIEVMDTSGTRSWRDLVGDVKVIAQETVTRIGEVTLAQDKDLLLALEGIATLEPGESNGVQHSWRDLGDAAKRIASEAIQRSTAITPTISMDDNTVEVEATRDQGISW
jgi:hypothetical protein